MKDKKNKRDIHCPICRCISIKKTEVRGNLRSDSGGWEHDAYECKACHCEFTIWS